MPPRQAGNARSPVYGEPAMKSITPSFRACDGFGGEKTNSMSTPSSRKNPSCTAAMATKYDGEIASTTVSRIVSERSARRRDRDRRGRVQHGQAVRRARRMRIGCGAMAVEDGTRRREDEAVDAVAGFDGGPAVDEERIVAGDAHREQQRDLGSCLRVGRRAVTDLGDEPAVVPDDVEIDGVRTAVTRDREHVGPRTSLRDRFPEPMQDVDVHRVISS